MSARSETVLDRILAHKHTEVEARKRREAPAALERRARAAAAPRGFERCLRAAAERGTAVIAEIKKASPSKGVIRPDFDPVAIARSYAAAAATCLSVLTDEMFFQGHDAHLEAVRVAVPLPLLRKDFVVDAYQLYEARALGADCVLLIVGALSQPDLESLHALALTLGLDVLLEVHDAPELDRALELAPSMIGINNRDLRTFETTLEATFRLLPGIPTGTLVVSESGIGTPAHVARLRAAGVRALLVGEAFMREPDPGSALRRLLA